MPNLGELFFSIIAEDKASPETQAAADRIAGAAVAIGAGMTVVGGAATMLIDSNREMDASFKTTALSMGVPAEAVKALARDLQSVDTPIEEVAAQLDLLGRAGITNVDTMGTVATAFDTLADATGNGADTMTDAMIPAFNALNIPLADAPKHVDGLATMFRKSNTDLGDFSKVMTKLGPELGQMGVDLLDVESIMMIFADRGITGRAATTALTEAVDESEGSLSKFYDILDMNDLELEKYGNQLLDSKGAAEEFADAQNESFGTMDKIGFELEKLKQHAADLIAPFEGVATAMLTMGPAVATVVPGVAKLGGAISGGGGLIASVGKLGGAVSAFAMGPVGIILIALAAVIAVIILLDQKFHFIGPTLEWLGGIFKGIGDWLGATFGPIIEGIIGWFNELSAQLSGSGDIIADLFAWFQELGGAIVYVGGIIGSVLGPAIQALAGWIGSWLGPAIINLVKWFQEAFRIISEGWAALGRFFQGGEGGFDLVAVLQGIWTAIHSAAQIAWNLITSGIRGIVDLFLAGIRLLWDGYMLYLSTLWNLIKSAAETAWNLITSGIRGIVDLFLAGIRLLWDGYMLYLSTLWNTIRTVAETAWNLIKTGITLIITTFVTVVSGILNTFGGWLLNLWNTIRSTAETAWNTLKTNVTTTINTLVSVASTILNTFGGWLLNLWNTIKTNAINSWEAIKSAAVTAAQGIYNGVTGALGGLVSWAQGIWNDMQSALSRTLTPPTVAAPRIGSSGGDPSPPGSIYTTSTGHTAYVRHHQGGIFEPTDGRAEGLALLMRGERVLTPSQTADYDRGLLGTVRDLSALVRAGGMAGGDIHVHGNVVLSKDYTYEQWRADVERWSGIRTQRGIVGA